MGWASLEPARHNTITCRATLPGPSRVPPSPSMHPPVHAHGQAALLGRGHPLAARSLGASVEALVRHLLHELLQRLGLDLLLQLGGREDKMKQGWLPREERVGATWVWKTGIRERGHIFVSRLVGSGAKLYRVQPLFHVGDTKSTSDRFPFTIGSVVRAAFYKRPGLERTWLETGDRMYTSVLNMGSTCRDRVLRTLRTKTGSQTTDVPYAASY